MQVVKNTLIRKALEQLDGEVTPLFEVLKGSSSIMFSTNANAPAKLIKELRKGKNEKPVLKAAYVDSAIFIGDDQLDALVNQENNLLAKLLDYYNHQRRMLFQHYNLAETNWQELSKLYKKEKVNSNTLSLENKLFN
jgi:ribosomal protein L10